MVGLSMGSTYQIDVFKPDRPVMYINLPLANWCLQKKIPVIALKWKTVVRTQANQRIVVFTIAYPIGNGNGIYSILTRIWLAVAAGSVAGAEGVLIFGESFELTKS